MTLVDEDYRLDLTKPAYVPPCAFTGVQDEEVDWLGHSENRPAAWVVELYSPPAVPEPSRIFVCDPCKRTLTSDLAQDVYACMGNGSYARVVRRLG